MIALGAHRALAWILLVLGVGCGSFARAADAALTYVPSIYHFQIDVSPSDLTLATQPRLVMNLRSETLEPGSCLYIAALDPLMAASQQQTLLRGPVPQDQLQRQGPQFQWARPDLLEELRPGLFRLTKGLVDHELSLAFSAALLGWKDRHQGVRILSEFYPRLLSRCPQADEQPFYASYQDSEFFVTVHKPESWSVLGHGESIGSQMHGVGPAFSLVFYQTAQVIELQREGQRLRILSDSPSFLELKDIAGEAISYASRHLGMAASSDFLLVETDDHEPVLSPGLITLNRVQQPFLRLLQEQWLRWSIWQLSQAIAQQWFGQTVRSESLASQWLQQGLAAYLSGRFLEEHPPLAEAFRREGFTSHIFQMNFAQSLDLTAALDRVFYPPKALRGDNDPIRESTGQSPFRFVKQALILRYLHWLLGDVQFWEWQAQLVHKARRQPLTPESFLEGLRAVSSSAAEDVARYWQASTWPDLVLESWKGDRQSTTIDWSQNPELPLAFDVEVRLTSGQIWRERVHGRASRGFVKVPFAEAEIAEVHLNPDHEIFDVDRFNNQSTWKAPKMFPGNARHLADDAYTILWFPSIGKLPGEGLSLHLYWQAYRYVGSDLSGRLVFHPSDGHRGYRLLYQHRVPDLGLTGFFSVFEGDGLALPGERLVEGKAVKRSLWQAAFAASLGARLRQSLGETSATHLTQTFGLSYKTQAIVDCPGAAELQVEKTAYVPSHSFQYQRTYSLAEWGCAFPRVQGKLRAFQGRLAAEGQVPKGAYFQAQLLDEARLRLDRPLLPVSRQIQTLGLDLALTVPLPLPRSLFALPRRSQVKAYMDWLKQPLEKTSGRVGGLGFGIPLGGDIMGRESITALQISAYSVLYRRFEAVKDDRPGFLFDLSGKL